MVKASYCVVLPVTNTVGYSKGQTNDLGPNAPVDVLKLSPNDVVRFSLLLLCTMAELTSLYLTPPTSFAVISQVDLHSIPTSLHFSVQHPPRRRYSNYSILHFLLSLLRATPGNRTFLTRGTVKGFVCVYARSSCVHSLQEFTFEVDGQCKCSEDRWSNILFEQPWWRAGFQ